MLHLARMAAKRAMLTLGMVRVTHSCRSPTCPDAAAATRFASIRRTSKGPRAGQTPRFFDRSFNLKHSAEMASLTQIEVLLPEFRAYAIAICASSDDAEDLVQDAIERALRTENRPTVLDELRPWMFRVIRNLHYDELRKRRVRREYLAAEKRLSDEAGTSDAARDVLIRMAFEKLSPDMREVLCLVDIMGLKYAEAAIVMNVANGTVMSRISRARKALLELVEGTGARDEIENSR